MLQGERGRTFANDRLEIGLSASKSRYQTERWKLEHIPREDFEVKRLELKPQASGLGTHRWRASTTMRYDPTSNMLPPTNAIAAAVLTVDSPPVAG